jgi:hypothetical protein
MSPEERKFVLEVLGSLRLDKLPNDALAFLREYLMTSSSVAKVHILLAEVDRHYGFVAMARDHHENVGYPDHEPADDRP